LKPDIDILRPDNNILRPDNNILRPDNNILRSDIDILRLDINIVRLDILRTFSHPPLSFYIPCIFHLPQDTVLEFWPLEKRGCVKCELLSNGMGIGIIG